MPTIIYFGEGNLFITVSEEPDQVEEAFYQANGRPFKLSDVDGGKPYVNPARIVFWRGVTPEPRPPSPLRPPRPGGSSPPTGLSPRHHVPGGGASAAQGPRLPLRYERPDQSTTDQIYRLEQLLPEPLSIGSSSAEYWVSYPDWFGETEAREIVRNVIESAGLHLLRVNG